MTMGELPFWEYVSYGLWQPIFWLCWLTALGAFILTWQRDKRIHALVILGGSVQITILVICLGTFLMFKHMNHCACRGMLLDFLNFLPVIWTPVVLLGIPVVLRSPLNQLDRSFRRAAIMTAVMALDVFAVSLGSIYLLSPACPSGHGGVYPF